jgi:hypothetical protein
MDPNIPPVTVQVNGTAAQLLVQLMGKLDTPDPMAVLSRALGMMQHALAAKEHGQRLGVYDPQSGRFTDLVI